MSTRVLVPTGSVHRLMPTHSGVDHSNARSVLSGCSIEDSVYAAGVEGESRDTKLGAYAFCVRGDEAVLLARMAPDAPDAGLWTLPGGGVEFGEHPDDAVLRELREETGLVGERGQVVAVSSRTYERPPSHPRTPFQHLGLIYVVRVEGGELVLEVGGSTDLC